MVRLVRLLQCCRITVDTTRGAKYFQKNPISRMSPLRSIAACDASTSACAFSARCTFRISFAKRKCGYTVWPSLVTVLTRASTHSRHSGERFPNRRLYSTRRVVLEVPRLSLYLLAYSFEWTWYRFPLLSFTHTFDAVLFPPLKRCWSNFL